MTIKDCVQLLKEENSSSLTINNCKASVFIDYCVEYEKNLKFKFQTNFEPGKTKVEIVK